MDCGSPAIPVVATSDPELLPTAETLAGAVSAMTQRQLAALLSVSDTLAAETAEKFSVWGTPENTRAPALFAFTGLLFKHLDACRLNNAQLAFSQKKLRILSGLYGLLKPFDLIEAYRLEMGCKLPVGRFSALALFWKERLTAKLKDELSPGEPIVSVASQEYMKAIDLKKLDRPVITPVFKERRADGTTRNVVVHAKKARGAIVRYAIVNRAETPKDLSAFSSMGWKAAGPPPESGTWLFTRPAK